MKNLTEEQLRAAIEIDPQNPELYYHLGMRIFENKELLSHRNDARDWITKASLINPEDLKYHFLLGEFNFGPGWWKHGARDPFKTCIHLNYEVEKCEKYLAEIKENDEKENTERLNVAMQRLAEKPDVPWSYANVAHCLLWHNKDIKGAVEYYEKGLAIDPNHQYCLWNLGRIYSDLNRVDDAINCFEKILANTKNKDFEELYWEMGKVYKTNRQFTKELALRKKIIELFPDCQYNYQMLGMVLVQLDKNDDAMAAFKEEIRRFPEATNFDSYDFLIRLNAMKLQFDEGLYYLEEGLKYNPGSYYFHYLKGVYFSVNGKMNEALKWYKKANALNPTYGPVYNNMATIYRSLGDVETGLQYLLKGVEVAPELSILHENLSKHYTTTKDLEKANYHAMRVQEIEIQNLMK